MKPLRRKGDKLELAQKTDDPEVLAALCNDAMSDVRRAVARRNALLSFEQLVVLYHDKEPLVSSTALSSLAKVARNESQNAEYQAILQDIAWDPNAGDALLKEVVYNCTDQTVLAALYFSSDDCHIKAGIIRHIQSPEILDAEVSDIIQRRAGERRVDNILCNPTLTKEQVLALIKARKLNPIDIICKVESVEALLGLAQTCHPTTITREHSVMADLTADELEALLSIDERYLSIVRNQLHKLGVEPCRALNRYKKVTDGWLPIAV